MAKQKSSIKSSLYKGEVAGKVLPTKPQGEDAGKVLSTKPQGEDAGKVLSTKPQGEVKIDDKTLTPKSRVATKAVKKVAATDGVAIKTQPIQVVKEAVDKPTTPIVDDVSKDKVAQKSAKKSKIGIKVSAFFAKVKEVLCRSKVKRALIITMAVILAVCLTILGIFAVLDTLDKQRFETIEIKEVNSFSIYKQVNGNFEKVDTIDEADNLSAYTVELTSVNMPTTFYNIKRYDPARQQITLDAVDTTSVDLQVKNEIILTIKPTNVQPLSVLVDEINANINGEFNLQCDYDASMYEDVQDTKVVDAIITQTFGGKLNGNGHKILNLKVPLFKTITNATIANLVVVDANIISGINSAGTARLRNATIASTSNNSLLTDIHISKLRLNTNSYFGTLTQGGLVAVANDNTRIVGCSVEDATIEGYFGMHGGLVGNLIDSSLTNCYAQGVIGNIYKDNEGISVGGLVGYAQGGTISKSVVDVDIKSTFDKRIGGVVGSAQLNLQMDNVLSRGNVDKGYKVCDTRWQQPTTTVFSNVNQLSESVGEVNSEDGIATVLAADITNGSFFNGFELDLTIFDIDYMNKMGKINMFKSYPSPKKLQSLIEGAYIPNYSTVIKSKNFDSDKEMLYSNLNKLMPYYKMETILSVGKDIDKTNILNLHNIIAIINNIGGASVSNLSTFNYSLIDSVTLMLDGGGTRVDMLVANPKIAFGNVATYDIPQLKGKYTPQSYVIDIKSALAQEIKEQVESYVLDSTDGKSGLLDLIGGRTFNIGAFITSNSPREYAQSDNLMLDDTFATIQSDALNFALSLLSDSQFNSNIDNAFARQMIKQRVQTLLDEITLAYTYYKNWYNFNIDNVSVYEMLFWRGEMFSSSEFSVTNLTNVFIGANESLRWSSNTDSFYKTYLSNASGYENVGSMLEQLIFALADTDDYNSWYKDNFSGIAVDGGSPNLPSVKYKVWDMLKDNNVSGGNFLLPSLSMDNSDLYFIGVPSQIIYGSIMSYGDYYKENGRELMRDNLSSFTQKLTTYFTNSAMFIDNADALLKSCSQLQIDSFVENNGRWIAPPNSTFAGKRNFMQAVKRGGNPNGSGAYANGSVVIWVAYKCVGDISTATHEMAHNLDGRYLLEGSGRRGPFSSAETYSTGMFEQSFGGNGIGFNWTLDLDYTANVSANLTGGRIAGKEKIADFYNKYFQTMYLLDLMELEALLSLPINVQSELIFQHSYPIEVDSGANQSITRYNRSVWNKLTEQEYSALNIKTYEDMVKNRLNIVRTTSAGTVVAGINEGGGAYSKTSIADGLFYTPSNESGVPDWKTFKRTGIELLGKYGYTKGFVGYTSGKNSNDLAAIRYASDDATMTFERFDIDKYRQVAQALELTKVAYFNKQDVVEAYKQAFLQDFAAKDFNSKSKSGYIRTTLLKQLLRHSGEFSSGVFQSINSKAISSAKQLVDEIIVNPNGNFHLTSDIDMSQIESTTAQYIDKNYTGILDGKGYSLINMTKPLLAKAAFATFSNLTIDKPLFVTAPTDRFRLFANSYSMTTFDNLYYVNSAISQGYTVK